MPFFYLPPVWDKIFPQFGTGFISISLDFHPYLLISTRQMAVQGSQVFLWAFIHICSSQQGRWQSRESFADQLHHILIIFQGLTNNARCRASTCRPRIVCRFPVTNDSNLWLKCLNNRLSAVIKIHEKWTTIFTDIHVKPWQCQICYCQKGQLLWTSIRGWSLPILSCHPVFMTSKWVALTFGVREKGFFTLFFPPSKF